MNLTLVLISLFVILGLISPNTHQGRKKFIIISCLLLMLSASLRSLSYGSVGNDTMNYFHMFTNISESSWSEIWDMFVARYFASGGEEDIGFLVLMKLVSYITSSFHAFTFIAELLFFIPFGIYLYRFSNGILELIFAFIFYTALVHTHAMSGARQFYAMGFGILVFLYFSKKEYKKAVISLLLGATIHLSLLLVVLPCLVAYLTPKQMKTIHITLFILFPIVMLMTNQIISFMGNVIGVEKYAAYGSQDVVGGTETFIFLLELLSLICYIGISKKDIENSNDIKNLYAMIPCFTFFGPLIYSNGSMIRISMYSYMYLTLLLPYALKGIFKNNYKAALWIFILALSFLMKGSLIYHFFWEVDPIYTW